MAGQQALTLRITVVLFGLAIAPRWCGGAPAENPPAMSGSLCVSGVYPHLAVVETEVVECGIGQVVPWADRLWFSTYFPKCALYSVDGNFRRQSHGWQGICNAGRMIHRESNQAIVGPFFIDAKGAVRKLNQTMWLTGVARHLSDSKNKVYFFSQHGNNLIEVDVHTLNQKVIHCSIPGCHGKGAYSGQGRVVVANNGWAKGNQPAGGAGCLAEWDGTDWKIITETQFCDVTGPGGIYGNDQGDPIWATGWDKRSVILMVRYDGGWHRFRLPKASYCCGVRTEWPRIREIAPGRLMMDMHGLLYDFPKRFRPGDAGGLRPLGVHLRMIPDFCNWNNRLVVAGNSIGAVWNLSHGEQQSNLWFGSLEDLGSFGRPFGFGGVWFEDQVKGGVPSDPFLAAGFEKRILHLARTGGDGDVEFKLESSPGDGTWTAVRSFKVPADGYVYYVLPQDFPGEWVRVTVDRDCVATAYFHYGSARGPANGKRDSAMFQSLADASDTAACCAGPLMPSLQPEWTRPYENFLWFGAKQIGVDGHVQEAGLKRVDERLSLRDGHGETGKDLLKKLPFSKSGPAAGSQACVQLSGYCLPRTADDYDLPWARYEAKSRIIVTERQMANHHGTFYLLPYGFPVHGLEKVDAVAGIVPIATHNKKILAFCSWRGLLVLAGTRTDANPDGHYLGDGKGSGLWFGWDDDLWQFGKPRGVGGPWLNTPVEAGAPSQPYLMTGYDKKSLDLSHDFPQPVVFAIEVDFLRTGTLWKPYASFNVPAGEKLHHDFPDGFNAHWVRVKTEKACRATARFVYE